MTALGADCQAHKSDLFRAAQASESCLCLSSHSTTAACLADPIPPSPVPFYSLPARCSTLQHAEARSHAGCTLSTAWPPCWYVLLLLVFGYVVLRCVFCFKGWDVHACVWLQEYSVVGTTQLVCAPLHAPSFEWFLVSGFRGQHDSPPCLGCIAKGVASGSGQLLQARLCALLAFAHCLLRLGSCQAPPLVLPRARLLLSQDSCLTQAYVCCSLCRCAFDLFRCAGLRSHLAAVECCRCLSWCCHGACLCCCLMCAAAYAFAHSICFDVQACVQCSLLSQHTVAAALCVCPLRCARDSVCASQLNRATSCRARCLWSKRGTRTMLAL